MKYCRLFIGYAVFACLGVPHFAEATTPNDKLKSIETQLNQEKKRAATLEEQAKETGGSLAELRHHLIASTEALEVKTLEEQRLEDKLDELQDEIVKKNQSLEAQRKKLKLFTTAMIELARQPIEAMFLQTGLTTDFIRRSILIHATLPHLKEDVATILHDIATLNDMQTRFEEQKRIIKASRTNLVKQQQDLDQLIKTRQGILQRTEDEKSSMLKHLAALSNEAKDLRQLLDKVSPKHTTKLLPSSSFPRLKWPVIGNVTRRYGEKDADGVTSQGITFSALPGSPVVSPMSGKVVFAGPFRGYGQILILQHGNGYHSFLAGFGRIDVDVGQDLEAGEPLGVLPTTGVHRAELYFEWRYNSEPIDPAKGITLSKSP